MALTIKLLLAALTAANFSSWLFVIIATAVTDWSKSDLRGYGIWDYCNTSNVLIDYPTAGTGCGRWVITEWDMYKDCEGALTATRGFNVASIIMSGIAMLLSLALMLKPTLIKKSTVLLNLCWVWVADIVFLCGWIMWLGVDDRGMCSWQDRGTHLGSGWFLQIFGWVINFFICGVLACLIFMKWKKTPRFAGQPPYVPGPQPGPAPAPYGPSSAMYPQYKAPYPAAPAPYGGFAAAPYSGVYGPTPNTSPFVPTPYW